MPYGQNINDPFLIYEEILNNGITYPTYVTEKDAKKMMDQLINKIPEARLNGSHSNLKAHPYFNGFSWVLSSLKLMI